MKNSLIVNLIKMIVASFILATIIDCSSVKKSKHTVKEDIAEKREELTSSLSGKSTDSTSATEYRNTVNSKIYANTLGIEYNPVFDEKGILVPFHYNATDNKGNKTSVNIVGPAKVINTIIDRNEESFEEILEQRKVKWHKVDSLINKLELETSLTRDLIETEKTKAPDYLKYIIWMGASITFLLILIVVGALYFKSQITKLKNYLP